VHYLYYQRQKHGTCTQPLTLFAPTPVLAAYRNVNEWTSPTFVYCLAFITITSWDNKTSRPPLGPNRPNGYRGSFPVGGEGRRGARRKSGQFMQMTTHLHLVSRFWMSGGILYSVLHRCVDSDFTVNQLVEISNKMQPCNRIYYSKVYWRFNMFRAAYRSSSGALNCICCPWFI